MISVRDRMRALGLLAAASVVAWACADVWTPPTGPSDPPTPPPPTAPAPGLAVSGTTFLYEGRPFAWRGVTAFDLPRRLAQGDRSFLFWARDTGFTVVRILVARQSGNDPRSYAEGIAELGPALDQIAQASLVAEVVVLADTAVFGMTDADVRSVVAQVAAVVASRPNVVLELQNEVGHPTQLPALRTWDTQMALLALLPRGIPASAGSSHGGAPPTWNGGAYVTHHSPRDRTPEANALDIDAAQQRFGMPVVDDEWIGFDEVAQPGRRSADPALAERQARAACAHGFPSTLHLEAGLSARVPGPVQQEIARRYVAVLRGCQ